jgi:putative toxin-antitoxin system antitoxin component (TIGR02293 family)
LKRDQILLSKAIDVLGDEQTAMHWLQTPKRALGNQIPSEIAQTESGIKLVMNLLSRVEHGVFS